MFVRMWQGWLHLAVVMYLFLHRAVGWLTNPALKRELVMHAVMMAV